MKVTRVKTYVIENEPGVRTGGGGQTEEWYIGGKYFLILELSTDAVSYTHLTLPTILLV